MYYCTRLSLIFNWKILKSVYVHSGTERETIPKPNQVIIKVNRTRCRNIVVHFSLLRNIRWQRLGSRHVCGTMSVLLFIKTNPVLCGSFVDVEQNIIMNTVSIQYREAEIYIIRMVNTSEWKSSHLIFLLHGRWRILVRISSTSCISTFFLYFIEM